MEALELAVQVTVHPHLGEWDCCRQTSGSMGGCKPTVAVGGWGQGAWAGASPYLPALQPHVLEVIVHPAIAAQACEEAPVEAWGQ